MISVREECSFCVIGHVGTDVYIASDKRAVQALSGAAFNVAVGACAVGTSTIVCATAAGLASECAPEFLRANDQYVRLVPTSEGKDNLYVFDLREGGERVVALSSVDDAPELTRLALESTPEHFAFHIATMPLQLAVFIAEALRTARPAARLSGTLYLPYLGLDTIRLELDSFVASLDLLFANGAEFDIARRYCKSLKKLGAPVVVRTSGAGGADIIVEGDVLCSYQPRLRPSVCTVGAGDVLAGALLGLLCRDGNISLGLRAGCDYAAHSVSRYGVAHILARRLDDCDPNLSTPLACRCEERGRVTDISATLFVRSGQQLWIDTEILTDGTVRSALPRIWAFDPRNVDAEVTAELRGRQISDDFELRIINTLHRCHGASGHAGSNIWQILVSIDERVSSKGTLRPGGVWVELEKLVHAQMREQDRRELVIMQLCKKRWYREVS
jgi:sugar/nucleoside kinase (ribokinase family)